MTSVKKLVCKKAVSLFLSHFSQQFLFFFLLELIIRIRFLYTFLIVPSEKHFVAAQHDGTVSAWLFG